MKRDGEMISFDKDEQQLTGVESIPGDIVSVIGAVCTYQARAIESHQQIGHGGPLYLASATEQHRHSQRAASLYLLAGRLDQLTPDVPDAELYAMLYSQPVQAE